MVECSVFTSGDNAACESTAAVWGQMCCARASSPAIGALPHQKKKHEVLLQCLNLEGGSVDSAEAENISVVARQGEPIGEVRFASLRDLERQICRNGGSVLSPPSGKSGEAHHDSALAPPPLERSQFTAYWVLRGTLGRDDLSSVPSSPQPGARMNHTIVRSRLQ